MADGGEDYEALRRRNIERNMAKLAELQLVALSTLAPTPRVRIRNPPKKEPPRAPSRASGRERKRSQASLASEESDRAQAAELERRREEKKQAFFSRRAKENAPKRHGATPDAERLKKKPRKRGTAAGGAAPPSRPPCEDCKRKDPSFGLEGETRRRWCQSCAKGHEDAVLLKKRRPCEDCQLTDPSFGLPEEKRRRWCHGCAMKRQGSVCLKASHGRAAGWSPIDRAAGRGAAAAAAGFFPEPTRAPVHIPGGWSVHYGGKHAAASSQSPPQPAFPGSALRDCLWSQMLKL